MLGDLIVEGRGQITVQRVLPSDGQGPRVEASFQTSDKVLGIDATNIGTYVSVMRPDGTVYGEGQGVLMTADGEAVTWIGSGVGRFGEGGAISYRGMLYLQTGSEKLARLNGIASVMEYEVGGDGSLEYQTWEWK